MPRPRRVFALLLGFVCSPSALVFATTAADICAPAANPCVASGTVNVTHGSILDFGARAFELQGTLQIGTDSSGNAGTVSILGGDVTIRNSGKIFSKSSTTDGGEVDITAGGTLDIQTAGGLNGTIDVSGVSGGTIALVAGGAATLNGWLLADATDFEGDGGTIGVQAVSVTIGTKGELSGSGGTNAGGGTIEIKATAGSIAVNGPLKVPGGSFVSGGEVTLNASGNVACNEAIDLNANGGADGGSGGALTIDAGGAILMTGIVNARGSDGDSGGSAKLTATTGSIIVAAPINVTGGAGGYGGTLEVNAGTTFTQQNNDAVIDASAPGSESTGGSVTVETPGGITLRNITTSAGGGGGDIGARTDGTLLALGSLEADGSAPLTSGGEIDLITTAALQVLGKVHANAPITQPGGEVTLAGCTVSVTNVAQVSTVGLLGINHLRAATQMTVAGKLTAGATNLLRYRLAGTPPIVSGLLVPAATIVLDPMLAPCGVAPPTTTSTTNTSSTSSTTTSTTTSTSSTTSVPPTSSTSTSAPTTSSTTTNTTSTSTTTTTVATTSTTSTSAASSTSTTSTSTSSSTSASTSTTTTSTSTTITSSTSTSSTTTSAPTTTTTTSTSSVSTSAPTSTSTSSTTTSTPTTSSTTTSSSTTSTATVPTTTTTTIPPECTATDATACNDGDRCTDDRCTDGACVHLPLVNYPAVECRLLTIDEEIALATGKTIPSRTLATRLLARIDKARTFLDSAQDAEGNRRLRRLRRGGRLVSRWAQTVERARVLGKIDDVVATRIRGLSLDAVDRLSPLTTGGK